MWLDRNNDRGGGLGFLLFLVVLAMIAPIGAIGEGANSRNPLGRFVYTLLTLALVILTVLAWCLSWPLWIAVVLTVFGSIFMLGLLLSALG